MTTLAPTASLLHTVLVNAWRQGIGVAPAANDNGYGDLQETLLRDALEHFGRHGLSAAESARKEAERAFFAGDRRMYNHWLEVCRALDRRLATDLARRSAETHHETRENPRS